MATRDDGRTQVARLGTDQTLGREQLRRCHQLVIACGQQKDRRLDFRKLNLLSQSNEAASCEFVALVELFHHFEEESTREVDGPGIPVPELCFEPAEAGRTDRFAGFASSVSTNSVPQNFITFRPGTTSSPIRTSS